MSDPPLFLRIREIGGSSFSGSSERAGNMVIFLNIVTSPKETKKGEERKGRGRGSIVGAEPSRRMDGIQSWGPVPIELEQAGGW